MIRVEIEPELSGEGYVLRVRDGQNGAILLSSTSQGYSRSIDAEKLARRLFGKPPATTGGGGANVVAGTLADRGAGGGGAAGRGATSFNAVAAPAPEAVELSVKRLDGTGYTETIR